MKTPTLEYPQTCWRSEDSNGDVGPLWVDFLTLPLLGNAGRALTRNWRRSIWTGRGRGGPGISRPGQPRHGRKGGQRALSRAGPDAAQRNPEAELESRRRRATPLWRWSITCCGTTARPSLPLLAGSDSDIRSAIFLCPVGFLNPRGSVSRGNIPLGLGSNHG